MRTKCQQNGTKISVVNCGWARIEDFNKHTKRENQKPDFVLDIR